MATFQKMHSPIIWKRQACSTLYRQPSNAQQVQAYELFQVEWDPSCLTPGSPIIDIYLYDISGEARGPVFKFQNVEAATGQFQTAFQPRWWNMTEAGSKELRLQFANEGEPNWASPYATGPAFTVNWNGTVPANSRSTSGDDETVPVVTDPGREKSLESGKLVAAILIPLLAAITAIGVYVWWSRKKQAKASKRWSQAVDRRMSQISQNWVASRPQSMAVSQRAHTRNGSNFSFGSPGASIGQSNEHRRQSTVSFAAQTSPSKSRTGLPQRPLSTASYPRVGSNSNKDILSPLSPEQESPEMLRAPFQKHHGHQSSVASSLRNEVSMFDEEQLAAAVSIIKGQRELKSSTERPTSTLSYETAPSSQSFLASSTGHIKQPSLVSLTVPRLDRTSMSPDNALEEYARAKNSLKVTTHVAARSLPSNNPFVKRLPASNSQPDLQVNYGEAR